MPLESFRKLSMADMARLLGLKPFDIARILGQKDDGLPADLAFEPQMLDTVRELAGVEVWWPADSPRAVPDANRSRGVVRALATKLVEHHTAHNSTTRADNLFRGLDGPDQLLVRRAVNQMIREGMLVSRSTVSGLHVLVDEAQLETLRAMAEGSQIPDSIAALWS